VLRIAVERCWTAEAARSCPELAALGEDLLEAISDASLIALHILVVRAQGPQTPDPWRREHVALLRSATFETMLDWSEDDLFMLSGSKWAQMAPQCLQDMKEEFAELHEVLGEFLAMHGIEEAGFLWAHKLLISRSVQIFMEDGPLLYILGPGQDMFNHSADAPVGSEDVVLRGEGAERALCIRAYRDFAAGEQAFYSYSGACNGRLLMLGGFVLDENPNDAVELALTLDTNQASLPLLHALARGLQTGLRASGTAAAEETSDEFLEEVPDSSQVVLHMRLGKRDLPGQLARIQAFFKVVQLCTGGLAPSQERLDSLDKDPADPVNVQARDTLVKILQAMLAGYLTPLEQDEATLPDAEAEAWASRAGPEGDRRRRWVSCLRVLIGEKRIYKMALEHLAK